MPPYVVTDLVPEHIRQLGLVVGMEDEAGPDLHHPVRGHGCIEMGRLHDVDTDAGAMRTGEAADDALDVAVQGRIRDDMP